MLKKFLGGLMLFCIVGFFTGCSSESAKPQVNKPVTTEKNSQASDSKSKLYSEDLKINQDEFILVYNDRLKTLGFDNGKNYDNLKITLDDPKTVEQTQNGGTHFYSGERGFISICRNSPDSQTICAAMITPKTNYKLPDMVEEVTALTQAVTQKQNNFKNVMEFVQTSLNSQKSNATNIDGLVISYSETGNFLTIIAENAKVGNGFERMVDNVIDSAKTGGYWHN